MIEPTQEQIREFWKHWGLVHINNPVQEVTNSCEAMCLDRLVNGWYKPDYSNARSELITLKDVPIIDFNNLFKYAVPIVIERIMKERECNEEDAYDILFLKWLQNGHDVHALFWAIWKVIKSC